MLPGAFGALRAWGGRYSTRVRLIRRFWRPLFSILPTVTAPISPVERTCVPPHACRSTPSISTRRTRPAAARRAHRHGPDQLRARVELGGIDPHEADRPVLGDPARDALCDLVLVDRGALEVEVEPAPVRADLTAGDRARHGRAQQVHRAVHAHQAMPARPVDLGDQAARRRRAPRCRLPADARCVRRP